MGIFKSDLNPGQILWVRYSVGSSLSEYLASLLDEEEIEKLTLYLKRKNIKKIVLLDSIFIPSNNRGSGEGSFLLQEFLDIHPFIILIADKEGRSLENWYSQYGFKKVFTTSLGCLMIKIQ